MNKSKLDILPFSRKNEISTLVENRRAFTLSNFELNVYETYEASKLVPLRFNDVVIINMIKGKKIMHLDGLNHFDYMPGETLVLPADRKMRIDFPEAKQNDPTQCTALTISNEKIIQVIEYLNEFYPRVDNAGSWGFSWDRFHFDNNSEIAYLANKLFKLALSHDAYKEVLADLTLKELLIRIMQVQNILSINESKDDANSTFSHIKDFVQKNLTMDLTIDVLSKQANMSKSSLFRQFKNQFGVSPGEFIILERLERAKNMLKQGVTVKESCYAVGFNDVNYFVRIFKNREGITPGKYALLH